MADIIDEANDLAEEQNSDAINAVRRLVPTEKATLTEDDLECVQCGDQINPARAAKGYDTCIECSREAERASKQFYKKLRHYDD